MKIANWRRGEDTAPYLGEEAARRTACTTRSTEMPVMHRKSIGQVRRKQGEQGALAVSNWWRASPGRPGPVNSGEVLPNGTTTGVPTAAATCIGPESFVSKTRQSLSKTQSSRRDVLPAKFTGAAASAVFANAF